MGHRFFVTLWILWLPQQILCRPPNETAVDPASDHATINPSNLDQIEENGEHDGQWNDETSDMLDEHQNHVEDSGENLHPEQVTAEQENQIDASLEAPKEDSEEASALPVSLSKRLEASDQHEESAENGKGQTDASLQAEDKGSKEDVEELEEAGSGEEIVKGAEKKGPATSPKSGGKASSNPAVKPVAKGDEAKKKASTSPARTPADKSKWQTVRNQLTLSADRKNSNQNKRQPLADINNKVEPTKSQKTAKPAAKTTGTPNRNRVELVGNISDLLSTVGKKVKSFEDINKRVAEGNRLKRSVPSVGAKTTKRSTTKIVESPNKSQRVSKSPLRVKVPRKEVQLSSKPKPSKAFGSPLLPTSKRDLLVDLNGQASGTEEYERLMAQRANELDEPEEEIRPMAVKQLPKRLGTVSGDFGAIANLLGDNIKSVSAANKDMVSRRGLNTKTPLEVVPLSRRGGPLNDGELDYADDTAAVKSRGDNCECYNKYSAYNVVRRTAKRVVRAVRHGTNKLYDGVDFTIAKSKDLKDAVKADIVDPAVKMLPLVGPAVGAVVDTGDAISDSAIGGARAVVQGGQQLNDGVLTGVEGMLKKDKTCRCADTRGTEQEEELVD